MTARRLPDRTIDATDRRILAELQGNGRITNVELAGRCHLSPAACLVRVRALEQSGYIQGYRAILDPAKLGQAMVVFVEIRLDPRNSDSAEPQVLRFPSGVSKVGARAERYRNLLVNAARSLGDEYGNADVENLLPAAIAHKLLSENEIQTGKHRFLLRRTIPLSMDQANSVEERTRDPRNPELIQTPYEADITFYRGEVQVTRAADPLEVSPILREPQP